MSSLRAERLGPEEVAEVHAIIVACARDLKDRRGLLHWDPPYPLDRLRADAVQRSVYAVREGQRTVATFTVGTAAPRYYDLTVWAAPDARALYVNRLAVWPELQGQGTGRASMALVEELARAAGCEAVRLDASERDPLLLAFYEGAGYERRGALGSDADPFVYFEKCLR